jgi:Eukaryotic-type carbonic anhydrase
VNGSFHDAEYHFVFANDKHSSFEEASKQPQGLAVLAIFCKVSTCRSSSLVC